MRRGPSPSRAASTDGCTASGSGRCASTRASARPRRPTSASSSCSPPGQTGLSCAFDLPTQMGYDSDHPRAEGEVGKVGVAISSIDDMRLLLAGLPLDEVTTSMTINATAATLLLLYELVGEEQGVDPATAPRHDPERHPEGVRRSRHVHLPAPTLDAARHRHVRLLPRAPARAGTRSPSRATTSARRARRPSRRSPSRLRTASPTCRRPSPPVSTSTSSHRG